MFLTGNVVFSVLIQQFCSNSGSTNFVLVGLRVVTLDGLFLIMGITLAIFIMIVSDLTGHALYMVHVHVDVVAGSTFSFVLQQSTVSHCDAINFCTRFVYKL